MTDFAPAVSIILFAYNQAAFAREAAQSCLNQDCEPIEIILSDDSSSDDTFAILQDVAARYRGPHRVRAQRTPRNLGIGGHVNMLIQASSGALIVPAAGDDFSEPDRIATLLTAWRAADCRPDLIATHVREMSWTGEPLEVRRVDALQDWRNVAQWAARRPYIVGAGHAFTRRLFDRFGLYQDSVFCEDQINTFRAIVSGGALTLDCAPVRWRVGGSSTHIERSEAEVREQRARRHRAWMVAEHAQLTADAAVAGVSDQVAAHLRQHYGAFLMARDLDGAQGLAAHLRVAGAYPQLSTAWRYRRALQHWWRQR